MSFLFVSCQVISEIGIILAVNRIVYIHSFGLFESERGDNNEEFKLTSSKA